ncbi:hypothetical protein [Methanobacterium petrolearium]|uniref:hypothetical protein n=1 Tax=Methanobacterium petrolearium TaxID=710190 RepID=UPI0030815224|nr:hypothetical protein [Methanobacterium petrolearium]BDZ71670.1 hypothetical protein GCM10025861_21870 [Methanobacterium petrolearium]
MYLPYNAQLNDGPGEKSKQNKTPNQNQKKENIYKKNKKDKLKQLKLLKREIRNLWEEIIEWESYVG